MAIRVERAQAVTADPQDALQAMMAAYADFGRRHPGRYAATMAVPAAQAAQDAEWLEVDRRMVGSGLALAARFGLTGAEALHALRGWRALAHGFVDLERRGGFGLPLDSQESYRRAVEALSPRGQR